MKFLFVVIAVLCLLPLSSANADFEGPLIFSTLLHKQACAVGQHRLTLAVKTGLERHPLYQGDEREMIELSQRPRFDPTFVLTVSQENTISDIEVQLGDFAFAAPPFRLVIRNTATKEVLNDHLFENLPANATAARQTIPGTFHQVQSFPEQMTVELIMEPQATTTFTYELADGVPAYVLDSHDMYDLVPHNSSMLMKFMIRRQESGAFSVWVTRKPPMPSFELIVQVDGKVFSESYVSADGIGTDAVGYDINIDKQDAVEDLRTKKVVFVVHFFERHRSKVGIATIDNLRTMLTSMKNSGTPNEYRILDTSIPHLKVKLHYNTGTNFMGLKILQPGPISSLLVSMYYLLADGTKTLMLREDDDVVPYYADHTKPFQFGWDDALPMDPSAVTVDGVDKFNQPVQIEIRYNPIEGSAAEEAGTGVLLQRWLSNYGGDASNLDLQYLDTSDHSHAVKHHVRLHRPVKAGQIIASVPYAVLLTSNHVQRSVWQKVLNDSASEHEAHCRDNKIHNHARPIMELTIAVLLHLFEESTNFRVYFNTFGQTSHKLPLFFSESEMAAFSFDKELEYEVNRMKELWNVEYKTVEDASARLPRHVSKDQYFKVRSQVETRLLNLTSSLVLPPILDLFTHNDDPTAVIEYNDQGSVAVVRAKKDIPHRGIVSVDFGIRQKTKFDFLLQFGFVPPGAIDAVGMRVGTSHRYLTRWKDSRKPLMFALVNRKMEPSDDDDGEALTESEYEEASRKLEQLIRQRLSEMPEQIKPMRDARIMKYAQRLLNSEREVLSDHLKWLSE